MSFLLEIDKTFSASWGPKKRSFIHSTNILGLSCGFRAMLLKLANDLNAIRQPHSSNVNATRLTATESPSTSLRCPQCWGFQYTDLSNFWKSYFWITILNISSVQLLVEKYSSGSPIICRLNLFSKTSISAFQLECFHHFLYSCMDALNSFSPSYLLFPLLCSLEYLLSTIFIQMWPLFLKFFFLMFF